MLIKKIYYSLRTIAIVKTLLLNVKLFGPLKFYKLRVIVGKNVEIRNYGNFIFSYSGGRVHLGSSVLFNSSNKYPLLINNNGIIKFNGPTIIQPGAVIYTAKDGMIEFLGNNRIGAHTQILCRKKIKIGINTGVSWNCQISDTDFHFIENIESGEIRSNTQEINIGSNVWIGNHVCIAKGVCIKDGCIIGQNTYVNKSVSDNNKIVVGIPMRILNGYFHRIWDNNIEKQLFEGLNNRF